MTVGNNIPVGYSTPKFPSLYFPNANGKAFHLAFLYYPYDIWKFTVLWTLIFFGAFHMCVASLAVVMHRKFVLGGLWIIVAYSAMAGIQALISGSIVGLLIGAIYKAGLFGMSTWIPFVWGLLQMVFMVITSYSMMSAVA